MGDRPHLLYPRPSAGGLVGRRIPTRVAGFTIPVGRGRPLPFFRRRGARLRGPVGGSLPGLVVWPIVMTGSVPTPIKIRFLLRPRRFTVAGCLGPSVDEYVANRPGRSRKETFSPPNRRRSIERGRSSRSDRPQPSRLGESGYTPTPLRRRVCSRPPLDGPSHLMLASRSEPAPPRTGDRRPTGRSAHKPSRLPARIPLGTRSWHDGCIPTGGPARARIPYRPSPDALPPKGPIQTHKLSGS